jgi:hypothetical protein
LCRFVARQQLFPATKNNIFFLSFMATTSYIYLPLLDLTLAIGMGLPVRVALPRNVLYSAAPHNFLLANHQNSTIHHRA